MNALTPQAYLRPIERRGGHRGRTFKSGKLQYGGITPSVVDCLVVELSDGGARIETSVMVQVPEILRLQMHDTDRKVRRAWAVGNQIGLEFLA